MAHFLKRLELNGFKSFAGKTVLEFPEGITAIVGPNGSGKSNVVDAVRWLLGERDAKNLRGGKGEDLIFAGTPKKPRMGLAQASLHFENKNKFFPVDFSEVAVMRQVSRDGASKYYLNGSEILLRDLIDFFAKVRLGSKGLVIVGQGNSDLFIRVSPRERREMIEEILGLREYQLKKAEAERRLKNSQINLDKVKALIEEILPHLRSLKRQTSRWEKREEYALELSELENQFFGSQWQELHEKLIAIQKDLTIHKAGLQGLEKGKHAAEARQKEVEELQPKEREELTQIKEQTQGLLEKRSTLQKDLGRFEMQIEHHKTSAVSSESPSLQALLVFIRKIRVELQSGLNSGDLERRVKSILGELDGVLKEGKKEDKEPPRELMAQFEILRKDLEALEKQLTGLKEKEKTLEKNQEQFYRLFKEAVAAVELAKDHIEKWELKNREILFEKERIEFRQEELSRQIVQAGRKTEEFSSGSFGHPEEPAALERRIFRLRGDLASIGEIDEALVKEAKDTESRYEFLGRESTDSEKAILDLKQMVKELNEKIKTSFDAALVEINVEFNKFFNVMFGGGHAKLKVEVPKPKVKATDEDGALEGEEKKIEAEIPEEEQEGGVEVQLSLPRKRLNSLEMLSGGERSLVGIAALFALISVSPPPFLVLDEVDAPLDERNARRFADMLREFSKKTQFIVVTHNRATMEAANILYGVTLNEDGTSKILSLKLEQAQ